MKFQVQGGDSYPSLEVTLQPGEEIVAEAGAMCWMDSHVQTRTASRGGVLSGLSRSLLMGESFFQNTFSSPERPGRVTLTAGSPGTIVEHELDGDLNLEGGAYLASTPGVEIKSKFEGLSGLLKEGLFVIRATGQGTLFFNGYGDVRPVDVDGEYVVDNGYAVAWTPALTYTLTRAKKIRSFLFSDQLLLRFRGQGRVWVQSRSPYAMANFFYPYRPQSS